MKLLKGKDVFVYILVVICMTSLYSFEFFPTYSENYREAVKEFEKAKKKRTFKLNKLKESAKESPEYKEYFIEKEKTNLAWKEYKLAKENEKMFGFKSFQLFMGEFGKFFCFFTYAMFFFVRSFYYEKDNIGIKIFHISIISGTIFYFYWIFQQFQDFSKATYYFMTLLSAFLVSIGVYFITKYNKTTIQQLEESNEEAIKTIKQLEKEVLSKQELEREEERQRISEELHDGVLGKLFGTRMGLGFLDVSREDSKTKYQKFLSELQGIEKEIREVSHKLSASLDGSDIGFVAIVKQLLKDKEAVSISNYKLDMDEGIDWKFIQEVDQVNLYRIIQEALQNIAKHAKAKNVKVSFVNNNENIFVEIEDDGVGFDASKIKKGIGFKNIKTRVKRLKGSINIKSNSSIGTLLKIKMPYSIEKRLAIN